MQDSGVVRGFDSGDNLLHDRRRSLRIYSAFATQQVIESFTLHVFHHEKEHSVRALSEISDVNNVRVTNRRGRTRFTLEASDRFTFL